MHKRFTTNEDQLALPFGERQARTISLENRQHFFWFLAGLSFCSLMLYFYAIEATARNVAIRQQLQARVVEAGSKLGNLEFSYIELKNSVSMEHATERGFVEAKDTLYVSRGTESSLTLNTVNR